MELVRAAVSTQKYVCMLRDHLEPMEDYLLWAGRVNPAATHEGGVSNFPTSPKTATNESILIVWKLACRENVERV